MVNKSNPINYGNAEIIKEVCEPVIKLTMIRYEEIFDFLSEEPPLLSIQKEKNSEKIEYEQILRIRKWDNKQSCSWCLYSQNREEYESLVFRKVIWDMDMDRDHIRKNRNQKNNLLEAWPSIITKNYYMDSVNTKKVAHYISDLDLVLDNGIILAENNNPKWEWRDIELRRLYDWGQLHCTWSPNRKSHEIERKMIDLTTYLDSLTDLLRNNIYCINLNYSLLPEIYKENVVRNV